MSAQSVLLHCTVSTVASYSSNAKLMHRVRRVVSLQEDRLNNVEFASFSVLMLIN